MHSRGEMVLSTDQIEDDIQLWNANRAHGQAVKGEGWKKPEYLNAQCRLKGYRFLTVVYAPTEFPTMVSSSLPAPQAKVFLHHPGPRYRQSLWARTVAQTWVLPRTTTVLSRRRQ